MFDELRKLYQNHKKKRKLREADEHCTMFGGRCFALFPPSFYRKHTPEEIEQHKKEEIEKLRKMLEDYEQDI